MSDKEILKMDFYDLCGSSSVFMTDSDKIKYWREITKNKNVSKEERQTDYKDSGYKNCSRKT